MFVTELSSKFINSYKSKTPPWGPVGYVVYKRTYARKIEAEKRTEEWFETVGRAVNGLLKIGGKFTEEEAKQLYDYVFNLKCSFSGRALWQLGTKTVDKIGGDSMMNCWCCNINHPIDPFCFVFNELMLGGGVGYNIQAENVFEIPKVKYDVNIVRLDEKDVDFVVPDNREGWVELLRKVLTSFFFTGKSFTYSTICIRGKGAAIKSFGGTASGPEDLCWGIENICNVLKERVGKKMRPIDCLDVLNIIGRVVVAGNVRRSAQIALGDVSDYQYFDAKNFAKGNVPNWRSMSNNSVICNKFEYLAEKFWSGYNGEGEPYGLVNLKNCRKFGRLADGQNYRPDPKIMGTNPCGEIPLEPYESCNLAEIFLPNIKDEEEFMRVAELMYKVVKTISTLRFINDHTNEVAKRNHRLGIGVTGFLQAEHLRNPAIFNKVYKHIENTDKAYSKILGVKESIKLTTCKPSGTLSLLAGVTSGVHPAYSPYYIRRIRMASNDPLIPLCVKNGYHVEPQRNYDGSQDRDTMVVSFPIKSPENAVCAQSLSAVQQLEWVKWLQTYWADNSVSVTVYYKKEELPDIKKWLSDNYDESVKSVSFLLHSDHGFNQAPLEAVSKEVYEKMAASCKQITHLEDKEVTSFAGGLECESGACPIK